MGVQIDAASPMAKPKVGILNAVENEPNPRVMTGDTLKLPS
jgi:hypothetical protein